MNKTKSYNKQLFALVRWLEDSKQSIVQLSDIKKAPNEELEINAIYNTKWGNSYLMAELVFIGELSECNKHSDNMSLDSQMLKKIQKVNSAEKPSTSSQSNTKNKYTRIKNKQDLDETNEKNLEKNTQLDVKFQKFKT